MDKTQNYSLQKPLSIEKYSISVHNMNMDLIDSALKRIEQKNESQDNLLATKEALNDEIVRASEKENEIIQDLDSESTRAQNAENNLSNNISSEIERAITAENSIQENLSKHIENYSNIDNTSDMDKPVSTAQQEAINLAISTHNTSSTSHDDIRTLISELTTRLNALADSDDTTLDQLSEIVAYIKNNKDLIDGITTSKISISDIVDDLNSTDSSKVLSSKQGNVLKGLITDLTTLVGNKVDKISGKGLSTNDYTTIEKNKLGGIASGAEVNVQSDWNSTDSNSDAFIKNKPTSMPASDVHAWAKSLTKPTYNKSEIDGLDNVENKSSDTIRSELTKENVISALGYTPPTTNTTYSPSTATPKANGTASAGTESAYSRGDHVHPLQTSVSGNAGTSTKWATARNINGLSVQGDANRVNYGTCSTAAATVAKVVDCTGFALITGSEITVKFTITNTAANPTLNVNSTGAKAIYYRGAAISAGYLAANRTYTFRYNGTQYELVGDINTNSNTWKANSSTSEGYVASGSGQANKVWKTDANGNPAWRDDNSVGITYSDSEPTNLVNGMTWIGN